MVPEQENGFPPLPYTLNVRFFSLQIPNNYYENQLCHPLDRDLSSR